MPAEKRKLHGVVSSSENCGRNVYGGALNLQISTNGVKYYCELCILCGGHTSINFAAFYRSGLWRIVAPHIHNWQVGFGVNLHRNPIVKRALARKRIDCSFDGLILISEKHLDSGPVPSVDLPCGDAEYTIILGDCLKLGPPLVHFYIWLEVQLASLALVLEKPELQWHLANSFTSSVNSCDTELHSS